MSVSSSVKWEELVSYLGTGRDQHSVHVCACVRVCVCVRARARACVYTQGERMGEGPRIVQMVASRGYLEQLPT